MHEIRAIQIMEHEVREIMKPQASIHDAVRQFITIGKHAQRNAKALVTNDFIRYHKCLFECLSGGDKHSSRMEPFVMHLKNASAFPDKRCICGQKCHNKFIDMPRLARLDIFARFAPQNNGKFDILSLRSNSI